MCTGASPQTAEQKPDLTADWELYAQKSRGLRQETGARGWGVEREPESASVRQSKGQGLPPGTRTFQDLEPKGATDCCAQCDWRRKWVSLP